MDIGIIGGADGPTAVLVSSSPIPLWLVAVCGGAAAIIIATAIVLMLMNKK